jgi:Flp pilus assembly protein TadB/Mg-chelatase subunit ChlD
VKRLALIAAALIAFAALASSVGAAGSSQFDLVRVNKGVTFPDQKYVLSLQTVRSLTNHDVTVTENGGPVLHQSLVPASQASEKTFGVVLVLDTSYSMSGEPLNTAVEAEQAFANYRNPNQELGALNFWNGWKVALPLTTSATKISTALSSIPPVHGGTHIYDAVAQAEAMLTAAHIGSGSIVVLSDGADRNSTKTLHEVGKTARDANMRIYTIGLAGPTFNPRTLRTLAAAGNGEYQQAKTTADLKPLFEQLGQQISSEYLLQYTSQAGPNKPVVVKVQVNGAGTKVTGYRTPQLTVTTTPPPPYKPSIGDRIWSSPITMIVLALLGAAVIAFLIIALLQPKRSGLPARMAEFVSIRGLQRDKGEPETAAVTEEVPAEQQDFWTRFERTLEIADIKMSPETIVAGTFALTALTFLLIYAGTGSWLWALFALGVPYLVREWVIRTLAHRRNRFAEQLPDALQVVASALRSGHSFAGALAVVVESANEPMKSEMQRVVAEEQLGIPMEQSLLVVAERMASRDVEQLALVSELQREAGGNAAEVIDRVAETVRERFDLRRLIQTLTMQGRMSRWIVSALPVVIILVLQIDNPHYLHPLLASTGGKVVFGLAAAWAVAGSYAIKKIVEIEV